MPSLQPKSNFQLLCCSEVLRGTPSGISPRIIPSVNLLNASVAILDQIFKRPSHLAIKMSVTRFQEHFLLLENGLLEKLNWRHRFRLLLKYPTDVNNSVSLEFIALGQTSQGYSAGMTTNILEIILIDSTAPFSNIALGNVF